MKSTVAFCLLLAFAAGAVLWTSSPQPSRSSTTSAPLGGGPSALGSYDDSGVVTWIDGWDFIQRYFCVDFSDLSVRDDQFDPETGELKTRTHSSSASFDILYVASARLDLFCVAGFAPNGDFVLERWKLKPKVAYPGGPPATDLNGMVIKAFKKTEIFRGPLASELIDVDFDPEARFMIALVRDPGGDYVLYRFDNAPSTTPVWLYDSVVLPELAAMTFLNRFDHYQLGRVWSMDDDFDYQLRILLIDSDNDGVFEDPPLIGDPTFYEANGLDTPEDWDDLRSP